MIGQMRGSFGYAPCVSGRARAKAFAREGDQEVVAALGTMNRGKAVSEILSPQSNPASDSESKREKQCLILDAFEIAEKSVSAMACRKGLTPSD